MSDVWQPIDDTARSGELFKVRFAPLPPGQERRELTARYLGVGAWLYTRTETTSEPPSTL
jgi:hypothetical protein